MKLLALLTTAALAFTPAAATAKTSSAELVIDLLSAPALVADDDAAPAGSESASEFSLPRRAAQPAQPAAVTTTDSTGAASQFDLISQPLTTDEFQVVGLTWEGADPTRIDIRVYTENSWSPWYALEIEEADGDTVSGTEPYIAPGATGVQVRTSYVERPEKFRINLMTGTGKGGTSTEQEPEVATEKPASGSETAGVTNPEDLAAETLATPSAAKNATGFIATATAAESTFFARSGLAQPTENILPRVMANVAAPRVLSRTSWGGPARSATWAPKYADLRAAVVHHTAGQNNYTAAQAPQIVYSIWNYHTHTLGWGDIGYNFLVDKYGKIYEGRTGSLAAAPGKMVVAGHAYGANTGTVGVSVMGNYSGNVQPGRAELNALTSVLAWQLSRSGVNPHGTWTFFNSGWNRQQTVPTILGHKDVGSTACPGNIYNYLAQIRRDTALLIANSSSTSGGGTSGSSKVVEYPLRNTRRVMSGHGWPKTGAYAGGNFDGKRYADLLLKGTDGSLWLYSGRTADSFYARRQIGIGWNIFSKLHTGVDFDMDGKTDVIGMTPSGDLWLYPGNGTGGFGKPRRIGIGWSGFANIAIVQTGPNRLPTAYGVTRSGDLWLYPTNGKGNFAGRKLLAHSRADLTNAINVGDWNRDGYSDLLAPMSNGDLRFVAGNANGLAPSKLIGWGWGSFHTLLPGLANDIFAINKAGQLYRYTFAYRG